MQRKNYGPICLAICAVLCGWGIGGAEAQVRMLAGIDGIAAPRFAEADLDGDGTNELIVGGRVGPFRAVTDPWASRSARIEVHTVRNRLLIRRASSENLHVIRYVAAGDLDGDGRAEIAAAGDYRIVILRYEQGRLVVAHREAPAVGRFLGIDCADVDGDGRAEIAVAESRPESGEEFVPADIHLYRFERGGLERQTTLSLDLSVGALCFGDYDGDGRVDLALEQGAEEVGGEISVYSFSGLQPYERFTQAVTGGHVRALNLSAKAADMGALLGVGDIAGEARLFRMVGNAFSAIDVLSLPGGDGPPTGLHLTDLFEATRLQVIFSTSRTGTHQGRIWMLPR